MKIIEPSVTVNIDLPTEVIYAKIESIGRVCYKSEDKITDTSAEPFIRNLIKRGHESVIEHISLSVRIVCDRGVSHEIVRHRLFSYSQESTRYCNYAGKEMEFIRPSILSDIKKIVFYTGDGVLKSSKDIWQHAMQAAESCYTYLIEKGATPQEARSVLPNSLKTELVMTGNLRNWRHFLKLRTAASAHPDMQVIAKMILKELRAYLPVIFEDIPYKTS